VDPNGLHEWAADCKKGDSNCLGQREWFKAALTEMREALAKADPKSQEYKDLKRVSDYYGEENQKTGISVGFTGTPQIAAGGSTSNLVTFDIKKITTGANDWKNAGYPVDVNVESAAAVAHEGSNAFDRIGRVGREDYPQIFRDEINAYRTQSDVNYLFNTQSPYGLWNPSWAKIDAHKAQQYRETSIKENAQKSTDGAFGIKRR